MRDYTNKPEMVIIAANGREEEFEGQLTRYKFNFKKLQGRYKGQDEISYAVICHIQSLICLDF